KRIAHQAAAARLASILDSGFLAAGIARYESSKMLRLRLGLRHAIWAWQAPAAVAAVRPGDSLDASTMLVCRARQQAGTDRSAAPNRRVRSPGYPSSDPQMLTGSPATSGLPLATPFANGPA